jgi:hypothetical protein
VIVKRLEAMRVVTLSENLAGIHEISEACGRMYPRLHAALTQHRVAFDGLSLALYERRACQSGPVRWPGTTRASVDHWSRLPA